MRSRLLLSIVLLAVTVGACTQSLTPDRTGTGGTTTGAGAVTGAGGFVTGRGGTGGSITGGGSGGRNVAACNTLMAEYGSAFAEAQTCEVGASGQCQQLVSQGLFGCGCSYVNDSAALAQIEAAWASSGCATSPPCEVACPTGGNYACVSADGGSAGVCSYVSGSGGVTGNDGSPLDGGVAADPCETLASEYAAVLVGASSCTAGAVGQCEQPVPASLSSCGTGCTVYVNDSSVLNVIQHQWEAAHCRGMSVNCPLVSCPFTAGGACVRSDAGGSACSTRYGQITTG
jgi:hypothetical protein